MRLAALILAGIYSYFYNPDGIGVIFILFMLDRILTPDTKVNE